MRTSAIIYGADERSQFYDATSPIARALLSESMVAFIPNALLDSGGRLSSAIPTWSQVDQLCPDEPFADEPAAAFCSGVLVDWDLVLTAGHCVRLFALRDFSIAFGYYYSSPGVLAHSELFRPVEIVGEQLDPQGSDPRLDYAWVRLDRSAAAPRRPAPVSRLASNLTVGSNLVSIDAGGGVPMLIDEGTTLLRARPDAQDYFVTDSDTSHGSSGGAAFSQDGVLLGVLARGSDDFARSEQGCATTVHADSASADEQYTYAAAAVSGLCATDPSRSICRPDCGEPCRATARTRAANEGCAVVARVSAHRSLIPAAFIVLAALGYRRRRYRRARLNAQSAIASSDPLRRGGGTFP